MNEIERGLKFTKMFSEDLAIKLNTEYTLLTDFNEIKDFMKNLPTFDQIEGFMKIL